VVGVNEPYAGGNAGECLDRHAFGRGLRNVLIEVRNDLLADARGQEEWADRLAPVLRKTFDP
jgi:predicted N-formylglutamate amidohydrolase